MELDSADVSANLPSRYLTLPSQKRGTFEYHVTEHLKMSGERVIRSLMLTPYLCWYFRRVLGADGNGSDRQPQQNGQGRHHRVAPQMPRRIWCDAFALRPSEASSMRTGGFSGNVEHDPHLLYTLSAVQILAVFNALDKIDADKVASCERSPVFCCTLIRAMSRW